MQEGMCLTINESFWLCLCLDDNTGQDLIALSHTIVLQKLLTQVSKEEFMNAVDFGLFIPKVCVGKGCSTFGMLIPSTVT